MSNNAEYLKSVLAMLHPSMLPAIKTQLRNFQRDALDDHKEDLGEQAAEAIRAVDQLTAELQALEETQQ